MSDTNEQGDTMNCGLGMPERELLHERLRRLPDTVPPRAVWQRIEEQARAEGLLAPGGRAARTGGGNARGHRWLIGAGLAAAVLLAILVVPQYLQPADTQVFPTVPAYTGQDNAVTFTVLTALMVESRELEEDLRQLPSQPQLVRAGTAATIAGLEDQIAAIDYRLNESSVDMTPEQIELYWRERVRLMNLLVQLRAAQAQRNSF